MYFLLQSEVQTTDPAHNCRTKRIFCPTCGRTQLYKLEENEYITKYKCWNKECADEGVPFVVVNEFIAGEEGFDLYCEFCEEPYLREIERDVNGEYRLYFKCDGKMCGMYNDPYVYDLATGHWVGKLPVSNSFAEQPTFAEDQDRGSDMQKLGRKNQPSQDKALKLQEATASASSEQKDSDRKHHKLSNESMPLLTMEMEEYEDFLEQHQNKIVMLVDVPNLMRTLHHYYHNDFKSILTKAHGMLLQFIENYFLGDNEYLVRYFSKPDDDLDLSHRILADCCSKNPGEFFHMLRIQKGGGFSDIDNYLIANGVEILERCEVEGFVIVSSDKDYLPVMRIADYRGVRSCMIGVNTSDIYGEQNIGDLNFLGILDYFSKKL